MNKDQQYISFLASTDKPQIQQNAAIMAQVRPAMAKFYYDPAKYPTYLDQLGIKWPPEPAAPRNQAQPDLSADHQVSCRSCCRRRPMSLRW